MQVALRYQKNREDAQSLVNQGLLKVFSALSNGKYDGATPFEFWMRRIMINTVIDEYRKAKKHQEHTQQVEDISTVSHLGGSSLNEGDVNLDADELRMMITRLPDLSQKVFNLCVLDGYEYAEVSEMLGVSESTTRWHVHNSRQKLKQMILESVDSKKRAVI